MTANYPVSRVGRAGTGMALGTRLILTVLGGAGLVVASFLNWTRNTIGNDLTWRVLYQQSFFTAKDMFHAVGGISILFGLIAVLGLADTTGWVTRLAGALGIILFALFTIQVQRSSDHTMQVGAWVALGGSIIAVVAGLARVRTVAAPPVDVIE